MAEQRWVELVPVYSAGMIVLSWAVSVVGSWTTLVSTDPSSLSFLSSTSRLTSSSDFPLGFRKFSSGGQGTPE